MKIKIFSLLLFFCGFSICSQAQLWNGLIAPSRAVDWSNVGIPGGIPSAFWTQCGSTIAAGASAATINSALASCAANHYVQLGAGTFNLTSGLTFNGKSNIELRGMGANLTILRFTGNFNCNGQGSSICIAGSNSSPDSEQNKTTWTAGYAKGTTVITLGSTSGITAGQTLLILDQLDDASDTGNVYVCDTSGLCSNGGPGGAARTDGTPAGPRSQQQEVLATAVNGNQVTISPGLYMPNWRSGQSPGAFWGSSYVSNDGVKDLTVDSTNSTSSTSGVFLFACNGCWVTGITSLTPQRNHVWLFESVHCTIESNYFFGTQNFASTSYGVEEFIGSDNLIDNNIFQKVTSPMMNNGTASGVVWAYNYTINDFYDPVSPNWLQVSQYLHSAGQDNILFEGNISSGLIADNVHGTHNFITIFRTRSLGYEKGQSQPKEQQRVAIQCYAGCRYMNIIGNVLGQSGIQNTYLTAALDESALVSGNTSIYTFGFTGNGGNIDKTLKGYRPDCDNSTGVLDFFDPCSSHSAYIWGNWDYVTQTTRFVSSEVPSALTNFPQTQPATHNLPPSLYLNSAPSFWGSEAFPPIGPDITPGSGTLKRCSGGPFDTSLAVNVSECGSGATLVADANGLANAIPAINCYLTVMNGPPDGSGPSLTNFNRANCYAAGTPNLVSLTENLATSSSVVKNNSLHFFPSQTLALTNTVLGKALPTNKVGTPLAESLTESDGVSRLPAKVNTVVLITADSVIASRIQSAQRGETETLFMNDAAFASKISSVLRSCSETLAVSDVMVSHPNYLGHALKTVCKSNTQAVSRILFESLPVTDFTFIQ